MSRTFSTNIGSLDSLNVSWRCGCNPKARQMRETAVCESPVALAIVRVLQCVAPRGTLSSVLAITASTRASSMVLGAPERSASSRPSRRDWTNRARHLLTICGVTRWHAATTLLSCPWAQASTMRARSAKACAVLRRNVRALSSSRSVFVKTSGALGLPLIAASSSTHGTREITAPRNNSKTSNSPH